MIGFKTCLRPAREALLNSIFYLALLAILSGFGPFLI